MKNGQFPRLSQEPEELSGFGRPPEVLDLHKPPAHLYLWGELPPGPRVAIVGSRRASPEGLRDAATVAERLASLGMTIVSGGARGIDTAAHRGALRAGGRTLVVAPVWAHRAYPAEGRPLFEQILNSGGAYVTEAERDDLAQRHRFFLRNALLAALCDVVILGESKLGGGATNATAHARRLCRPRLVLPPRPDAPDVGGTVAEHLRYQAPVYFHAAQVLSLFEGKRTFDNPKFWEASQKPADAEAVAGQGRPEKPRRTKTKRAAPGADAHGQESSLVLAVRGGAKTVDEIAEAAELPTDEVQYEILRALLRGDVIQDEQGLLRYQPSVSGPA